MSAAVTAVVVVVVDDDPEVYSHLVMAGCD